ncbi:mRNA cap guanine-N7 methyltransferase [Serendipita sp. 396]|nr:mRNA cap guanine-N7 methyltransferase [Serendipita sp. 396]
MPWDPVRHAMQEVSVNPKNGLTPLTPTAPTLIIPPNSALTSSPPSTTTPRATSLAMLLNDSTTYRSSPSPVMTRPGLPASLSSPSSSLNQLMNPVSPTRKPLSLEQNPDQKPKAVLMPPPKPSSPYNPQRISTAGSVLVPLSVSERRIFSSPVNSLRMALVKHPDQRVGGDSKDEHFPSRQQNGSNGGYSPSQAQSSRQWETDNQRKRKREETGDEDRDSPLKRSRGQDEKAVAYHYNQRPEIGVSGRRKSPIFGLKAFNNWIKSVLIQKMAHEPLSQSSFRRKTPRNATLSGRVLDIGCGKGGDLQKWKNAGIKEYVGLDLAIMSVNQARDRWLKWNGDKFEATFTQLDCYTHYLSEAEDLRPRILSEPFDVVTMQFCMHYAFETEEKVRIMLDNVTRYLRPGGRFVGTIPNSDILQYVLSPLLFSSS